MNNQKCPGTAILVDYADGELSQFDDAELRAHVRQCAQCRSEIALLKRSLQAALRVWESDAEARVSPNTYQFSHYPLSKRRNLGWLVAMCSTVAALLLGTWIVRHSGSDRPRGLPETQAVVSHETIDIDQLIANESQLARLSQAARILAENPRLDEFAARSRRYITASYPRDDADNRNTPRSEDKK